MKFQKIIFLLVFLLLLGACATHKTQYKNANIKSAFPDKEIVHSFYLIGDAGNSPMGILPKQ
jgi:uncharacterized lipoprotein YajG